MDTPNIDCLIDKKAPPAGKRMGPVNINHILPLKQIEEQFLRNR